MHTQILTGPCMLIHTHFIYVLTYVININSIVVNAETHLVKVPCSSSSEHSAVNESSILTCSIQGSGNSVEEWVERTLRANRWGGELLWNANFWIWHHHCTHPFSAPVVIYCRSCTRSSWSKLHQEWRRGPKISSVQEKLLAVDGCWWMKSHSTLGKWVLVGCPCFGKWPISHACSGSINWIPLSFTPPQKKQRRGRWRHEVGGEII